MGESTRKTGKKTGTETAVGRKDGASGEKLAAKLPMPELVPQAHGGALYRGGVPGPHAPGAGRPREAVRRAALLSYAERIPILEQIADGKPIQRIQMVNGGEEVEAEVSAKPSDRIKAIEALGKAGLGEDTRIAAAAEFGQDGRPVRFTLLIGDADE